MGTEAQREIKTGEIEIKKIREIGERTAKRFGAYSLDVSSLPVIQGVWTSGKTDKRYSEPMYKIELFIEDTFKNHDWLKSFKEIIKQDLEQEEIFIIVHNAEILR